MGAVVAHEVPLGIGDVGQDLGEELEVGVQGLAEGVVLDASCRVLNGTGVGRQAQAGEIDRSAQAVSGQCLDARPSPGGTVRRSW
jgi:hypothetical protein